MTTSAKSKKMIKNLGLDLKHEILGPPKKKPKPIKRSTMDTILGIYPKEKTQAVDQPSPIVEAMLQSSQIPESEEKPKVKQVDKLDLEIKKERQKRIKRDRDWGEDQRQKMSDSGKSKDDFVPMPSSPKKGPVGPKGKSTGKAQGIEVFKRGKKN